MMAAFLYLGAGLGLLICSGIGKMLGKDTIKEPLTRKELPYTVAMVVLDIAAPILLMLGIARTSSANVSLLSNFEIVATSLIALLVFKEIISRRAFAAILLVILASIMLGFEGTDSFSFHTGSLFVLGACICWGLENNCTKMISSKSSVQIVIIKGCFSGLGSLAVAFAAGEMLPGELGQQGEGLFVMVAQGLGGDELRAGQARAQFRTDLAEGHVRDAGHGCQGQPGIDFNIADTHGRRSFHRRDVRCFSGIVSWNTGLVHQVIHEKPAALVMKRPPVLE